VLLEAIEPRRLYRQVADQLRKHIDSGATPAGSRLPTERDLADTFNVSRQTIREALISLEVEGRVRIRVGSGIYVCEQTSGSGQPVVDSSVEHEGPFELLRARAFIEGAIAAEAAIRITPEHIAVLDDLILKMERSLHPGDDSVVLDCAFHVAVASILDNAAIERCVRDLFQQRMTPYFGRLAAYFENETTWREAMEEHRAIRNALVARDPAAASQALRTHLEKSQERFSLSFGDVEPAAGGRTMRVVTEKSKRPLKLASQRA
jgi:DNA-binding FadR family transcriptional regulator